jgi:hypothetical protein
MLQICGGSSIEITNGVFSEFNGNALADMGVASILGTLDEVRVSTENSGTAQNVSASTRTRDTSTFSIMWMNARLAPP